MTALAIALSVNACRAKTTTEDNAGQSKENDEMKSVIVYFTHSGNTEIAAKEIAAATGSELTNYSLNNPIHRRM